MSATLTPPLTAAGPMLWMAQAIQARLQQAFPATLFDFAWMPAKADRKWFEQRVRRTPAVALGWNGATAEKSDGGVFTATAHWTVALITKNATSPQARYLGDTLAPGLFAMARVATLVLHGYFIDPDGTPWTATGTLRVNQIGNLYNEEWGDEHTAVAALDIAVDYEETLPLGLEEDPAAGPLALGLTWNFGEAPPLLADNWESV